MITNIETLRKKQKKNSEKIWSSVFKLMTIYNYYLIDYNKLKKKSWE